MAARVAQIVRHGHTAEADEMMPILWLPKRVKEFAELAYRAIGVTGADRNLDAAEKRLAQTAALCLAAIDRLRLARSRGEG